MAIPPMTVKRRYLRCEICGCTRGNPCTRKPDGATCRNYDWNREDECPFCSNPALRGKPTARPRVVGKVVNMKYVYRTSNAYQVRVPIPELGKDVRGKTLNLSARFLDARYGSRAEAFKAALKFRDETLVEFNLSLDGPTRTVPSDVNIYWDERKQGYDVHLNTKGGRVREFFTVKTWVFKENAYLEARRWRDQVRADLGLPPAPGSLPVVVDFEARRLEIAEVAREEARAEIEEYEGSLRLDAAHGDNRRLITSYNNPAFARAKDAWLRAMREKDYPGVEGVTVTQSTREAIKPVATRRWADFALNNAVQASSGMHGNNRNKGRR